MPLFTEDALKTYLNSSAFRRALALPEEAELAPRLLAQGECNRNYLLIHPVTGKKLVLRVNLVSQMHLPDQISYEYRALKALAPSGRTPVPLYADPDAPGLGNGLMVYEYLPGRPLCYEKDLPRAAALLADIHSLRPGQETIGQLLSPKDPIGAVLSECREMVSHYLNSPLAKPEISAALCRMLERGQQMAEEAPAFSGYRCIINTELNSGNFLMNDAGDLSGEGGDREAEQPPAAGAQRDHLIDWEKPLYGEPAQDLGHFLAPTTTFWKTDSILSRRETEAFLSEYERAAAGRFDTGGIRERTLLFIPITCLRGLTWSAMAWVQYQDETSGAPKNQDTWNKLCIYLSPEFLCKIWEEYLT